MKRGFAYIFLFLVLIFSGCKKEKESVQPDAALLNFAFLKQNNPSLTSDIYLTNYGQIISGQLPYYADITELVASFEYAGSNIKVNDHPQQSGITINDFTQIVNYTITKEDGTSEVFEVNAILFTGLPMIFITTDGGLPIDTKEEYRSGHASILGGRNFENSSGDMGIRGRGHSTWYFHPKKPYQLKFDSKTEVLGMPADKKWIFLAEFSDKTLVRNKFTFEMGYMSNLEWTPQSVFAEVFVNDEYIGTYNISQKVEESDNRVPIGSSGYLLEIDTPDHLKPDDIYFNSSKFLIQIKEPETTFDSQEFNYIKNYIDAFETALFNSNFTDPETGYKKYIDVDSFVEWYLINEIVKNQDSREYSSIYLTLIPGEKMKMGPLWDFDLAYGNVDYSDCQNYTSFWVKYNAWIHRLFEDPEFEARVKERFAFFRENEEKLLAMIDTNAEYLRWAQHENDNKWDLIGRWVWPNPVVYNTYQGEVAHLKNWFSNRMDWLHAAFQNKD